PQDARALREAARGEFESVKPGLEVLKRLEFLRRLNEVPGFDMSETAIDKHPTLRLTDLGTADALAKFLEALDWLVEEVKAP
ncbi:MAG: hypothetical protein ACRDSJ_19435, partial [Rubrobacteraceae bacterium]